MNIVYLNGHFIPQEKAQVSIMDRGFLFGDGIYEVIPVFNGKLFGFQEHMARMEKSLNAIHMKNPLTHTKWKSILENLLIQNNKTVGNHSCYCQVTRGADETRKHSFPNHLTPTVVAFVAPAASHSADELQKGFYAVTINDARRRDCFIKAIALLPNILHLQEAKSKGAVEAILIRNDEALEGTSSNLFIVKNEKLFTPPLSHHILDGITRKLVIQLATENHIPCEEKTITANELNHADEIWVTGSVKEICPIVKLNDHPVGKGVVGPIWKRMVHLYEAYKKNHL